MSVDKKDVIRLLETFAIYLELKGENTFKVSAYRKAAQALETDDRSLSEMDDFTKIKGIGKGTSSVISEFVEKGESEALRELEKEVPKGLIPLLDVPGLGGKKLAKLYQELGVTDAESLVQACENGSVESLAGFGKKSAEKIRKAIKERTNRPERLPIAFMLPIAERIEQYLANVEGVERHSRAGSIRRLSETVKDLDFIISTTKPSQVRDALLKIDHTIDVIASGETKVSIVLDEGYPVNVDFRMVKPNEFITTLHHFTGSKDHNVAMRQLAKQRKQKINEYGVEDTETNEIVTFENEESFFAHFGLPYIPPEMRENMGEVDTRSIDVLQKKDVRGDLHMHTTWSDGAQSVEEMVLSAREMGYEFIAITDHSKFLRVANGLDEEKLRKQREEIHRLNEKYADIHIFAGVEMDILPDGTLDFSDDFLKEMDYVIGAIHSSFSQSEEQIMTRLRTALENPYVNVIAHPTGRVIGRRPGYAANLEALIEGAAETGTVLELNANPNRFDLSAEWVKKAQEAGVKIAINTDAHNYKTLKFMELGVGVGRKGWLRKENVINTWTKEELMKLFSRHR
ncbi:DNA polymerase/3'-5' exonuclease PolX [Radiobacillus kanasensis]|uniref:DNA polymerase/3'-5' exonuclease PolX n=1 Tax=Radiobacillus kanasensis TaxID=2844358 RepID=UPI001E4872F4|nr:DNA polymerase/3'-5' exonuclease PolX [Radiobacillus kanasensis]UFT97977.1 DNA polymerase/3'-5' exonuclease PolX [Radiobacillus kanasensis]